MHGVCRAPEPFWRRSLLVSFRGPRVVQLCPSPLLSFCLHWPTFHRPPLWQPRKVKRSLRRNRWFPSVCQGALLLSWQDRRHWTAMLAVVLLLGVSLGGAKLLGIWSSMLIALLPTSTRKACICPWLLSKLCPSQSIVFALQRWRHSWRQLWIFWWTSPRNTSRETQSNRPPHYCHEPASRIPLRMDCVFVALALMFGFVTWGMTDTWFALTFWDGQGVLSQTCAMKNHMRKGIDQILFRNCCKKVRSI